MPKEKMVRITTRMPESLRDDATTVVNNLGLDLNSAINLFLKQMVKTNSIPFKLTNVHLSELDTALAEARTGQYTHFDSEAAFFKHLDNLAAEAQTEKAAKND